MSKTERIQLAGGALFVLLCVLAVVLLTGCSDAWWAKKATTWENGTVTNTARRVPVQAKGH